MANSMVIKFACLVVISMMVLGAPLLSHATLTCEKVQSNVSPCVVQRNGGTPCCHAIRTLNSEVKTTADRQVLCRCLKTIDESLDLHTLSLNCGIKLPYKFTPSMDCNKIQ